MGASTIDIAGSGRARGPSEDLFEHVNRPGGANLPGAHREKPVQEGILWFGSLKAWERPKVRSSWRGVVTDSLERHVDEGAVVGLQRDAQIQLQDVVWAFDHPVV